MNKRETINLCRCTSEGSPVNGNLVRPITLDAVENVECQEAGCRGLVLRHSIRGRIVDQNIRRSPEPGGKRNASANLGIHIELFELAVERLHC